MRSLKNILLIAALMIFNDASLLAQPVPAPDENIPYLMTFGKNCPRSWGDDDFSQTFFFKIPTSYTDPFYIRVYDPDIGGDVDEINVNGDWNTTMSYTIYGGNECCSTEDAKGIQPTAARHRGWLLPRRRPTSGRARHRYI